MSEILTVFINLNFFLASEVEWTMNDLLQLKKPLTSGGLKTTPVTQTADLDSKKSSINHHKRPSISYEISSKRAKCHDNGTLKSTPQLLQQLITTTSSGVNSSKARPRVQIQSIKSEPIRYTPTTSQLLSQQKQQSQPQQASNSVLMNLLVSGCDVSAGYYTTCLPRPKVAKA